MTCIRPMRTTPGLALDGKCTLRLHPQAFTPARTSAKRQTVLRAVKEAPEQQVIYASQL